MSTIPKKLDAIYGPKKAAGKPVRPKAAKAPAAPPMLIDQHSPDLDLDTVKKIRTMVDQAHDLHHENTEAAGKTAKRIAVILLKCVELADLHDKHFSEFQEVKRGFGLGDGKRGTYNTSEHVAREVVKVVLRKGADRSTVTRNAQAVTHLLMIRGSEPDLLQYITDKGGLNGCAKAWRKYLSDLKGDQPESETAPANEDQPTRDSVPVEVPPHKTLFLVDPDGFVLKVPDDLGASLIATMSERQIGGAS